MKPIKKQQKSPWRALVPNRVPAPNWVPSGPLELVQDAPAHGLWTALHELGERFTLAELAARSWHLPTDRELLDRLVRYGLLTQILSSTLFGDETLCGYAHSPKGTAWLAESMAGACGAGFVDISKVPEWIVRAMREHGFDPSPRPGDIMRVVASMMHDAGAFS